MPKAPKLKSSLVGLAEKTAKRKRQEAALAAQESMAKAGPYGSTRKDRVKARKAAKTASIAALDRIMSQAYVPDDTVLLVGEGKWLLFLTAVTCSRR